MIRRGGRYVRDRETGRVRPDAGSRDAPVDPQPQTGTGEASALPATEAAEAGSTAPAKPKSSRTRKET